MISPIHLAAAKAPERAPRPLAWAAVATAPAPTDLLPLSAELTRAARDMGGIGGVRGRVANPDNRPNGGISPIEATTTATAGDGRPAFAERSFPFT